MVIWPKVSSTEKLPNVFYFNKHGHNSKQSYYTFFTNSRTNISKTLKIENRYKSRGEEQTQPTTGYNLFINHDDTEQLDLNNKNNSETRYITDYKIPNIVHYIWYNNENVPLLFHNIMSAHKVLKPDVIYFHTNNTPIGIYWQMAKRFLIVKYRKPSRELFGKAIRSPPFATSDSNVDRVNEDLK